MWLTKDPSYPEPVPMSAEAERGSYIFFNHQTWQRARVRLTVPPISRLWLTILRARRNLFCSMTYWTIISQCDRTGCRRGALPPAWQIFCIQFMLCELATAAKGSSEVSIPQRDVSLKEVPYGQDDKAALVYHLFSSN